MSKIQLAICQKTILPERPWVVCSSFERSSNKADIAALDCYITAWLYHSFSVNKKHNVACPVRFTLRLVANVADKPAGTE